MLTLMVFFFWKGFSAKLTPESLQSFQSLTGDVIDYVGVYTPKSGRHAQLIVVI
jgi:hypothetical protein